MNSLVIIFISIVCFVAAYATYGSWLAKKWGLDPKRPTPAHTRADGVDYVPAKAPVLLGHHFSSIAGAAPIIGPISAAVFGWLPVVLWIVLGSIFFGGVHDMGALFASVRHDGKSIGEVISVNMGQTGKKLFSWFAWLTLLLVIAAFTAICASTFTNVPSAATSSLLFMVLAVAFGFLVYRRGAGLAVSSVIGVALLFVCIWLGLKFPLSLSFNTWVIILLVYIGIASVAPVWILLQPRDYLNSFLLYAMLIGGALGVLIKNPKFELAPVTAFNTGGTNYLFPMLFVTVACGAISGFHSLVGSGTTSKQIDNEKDIKLIGYGSMLIEGFLAILAITTAAYIGGDQLKELLANGGPTNVFANGLGNFMASFGIPFETGKSFTALTISAFALTSLDTATRLGRFIFQEMFDTKEGSVLGNMYVATGITVVLGGALTFKGWRNIWPIFGSANQLLAALALLSLAVYLKKIGKDYRMASIPTVFMFTVTVLALILLIYGKIQAGFAANAPLIIIAIVLLILSIVLIKEGIKALSDDK
ncbi:carbon starvation protein A [Clostridium sediminicola]|uniref:carbon starvation CstA family protein n=1 Tax=Clostridium sediminicola TaxID=3114879 RepID=UPI0031F23E35